MESKLLLTLIGLLLLVTGTMWIAFFPPGGVMIAIGGLIVLLWSLDLLVFGGHGERHA
jgi:hypothetical protein